MKNVLPLIMRMKWQGHVLFLAPQRITVIYQLFTNNHVKRRASWHLNLSAACYQVGGKINILKLYSDKHHLPLHVLLKYKQLNNKTNTATVSNTLYAVTTLNQSAVCCTSRSMVIPLLYVLHHPRVVVYYHVAGSMTWIVWITQCRKF